MLGFTSQRAIQHTMTGGAFSFNPSNLDPWFGLFNNGQQGEVLVLRDLKMVCNTIANGASWYVQGTNGGAIIAPSFNLDVNSPVLPGVIYGGSQTITIVPSVPGYRFWPASSGTPAFGWAYDRPIAVIYPGWMYMATIPIAAGKISGSFEWLVTMPKELY